MVIKGEIEEKLMNIGKWAPETTPLWIIKFCKWLVKNIESEIDKIILNDAEYIIMLQQTSNQLSEAYEAYEKHYGKVSEVKNPLKAQEQLENLPEYKKYLQLYKAGNYLLEKLKEITRYKIEIEIQKDFEKYAMDRIETFKELHSAELHINPSENVWLQFRTINDRLDNPISEI